MKMFTMWIRSWARTRIKKKRSGVILPEVQTTRRSSGCRLPQEIVQMIIDHLMHDPFSLRACCSACYSWYIAAAPHLHNTLVTPLFVVCETDKSWWPASFRSMHELGLFPLVRKFRFQGSEVLPGVRSFSPELFDPDILHQFSALTNVRELRIDFLDIPSFMPQIRQYFGHFLPTVRSLALSYPKGSSRQIIFFIGLFRDLEDLHLPHDQRPRSLWEEKPANDPTLVPPFIPPLRGRFTATRFKEAELLEDMVNLFGGIRFRQMSLCHVNGAQLLLDACAETLEVLELCAYARPL